MTQLPWYRTVPSRSTACSSPSDRSLTLSAATLASEALVQQVLLLAAWRTATAGRPKGEDLYSPRKDLGADLRRAAPAARGPGALRLSTGPGAKSERARVARLTQNRTCTYSIHKAYEAYCAHSEIPQYSIERKHNPTPHTHVDVHAVRERQRARRNRRAQCTGARQQRACAR